jgi:thiamine-phosphate pyrophosphorylase
MRYTTHEARMHEFCRAGLYVVTGEELSAGRTTEEVVQAALEGGCRLIQMREKGRTVRELLALGRKLRAMTAAASAILIINDRVDIALAVDADGVHLGQDDLPINLARRIAPELIIGSSSHDEAEAAEAQALGASYVNIGPIFKTATKVWNEPYLGVERMREIASVLDVPFTVMGGIKHDHIPGLREAGARTIALVTAVTAADDPKQATAELLATIRGR